MGIQNSLRNVQDRVRNAGWRIPWIPWQEPGKPEYVYNTPVTLITGFGGVAVFLFGLWYAVHATGNPNNDIRLLPRNIWAAVAVAVSGLLVTVVGRIYAAVHKQAGWKPVIARCIDREIRKCKDAEGSTVWDYRLLCEFDFNGRIYRVTPESSRMTAFNTERGVLDYLDRRIGEDGVCRLWIDTKNPLHAVFDKKQKI